MPIYQDQMGRNIELTDLPQRIISVVPSQTEALSDLGLNDEVVGITKFCIHPEHWFRSKTRVGGTKNLHLDRIRQLKPHLIIANKEENVKEQVEALAQEFPVWVSDVNTLGEACDMIRSLGCITGRSSQSEALVKSIQSSFAGLPQPMSRISAAYLIWKDPYMTVGGDSFISNMLDHAGFRNIFEDRKRYPQLTVEDLVSRDPAVVLLSSEPYPFKQHHLQELQAVLPNSKVLLVDGELFSWYGSRLRYSAAYFKQLQAEIVSIS